MRHAKPRLLYVVNIPRFFVSHRLPLALAARDAGYEAHVATADIDPASIRQIKREGFPFHALPLSQHGLNPLAELRTLVALGRLYRSLRPDILHHVSLKPVVYGGIAARLWHRQPVVQAVSGRGYLFVSDERKARLLARLSRPALRLALAGARTRVLFQNPDDQRYFVENGLVEAGKTVLIRGSGVDAAVFHPEPEDSDALPVVLFAGRLLWQKGIGDFVAAARRLRGMARFRVVGYEEATSPLNVPGEQLLAWQAEGAIEWLGKRDDMPRVYADSHIVCLPSSYGEGLPKTLIEAAACARACVASDSPGCREIVRHGLNGLLAPPGDVDALCHALRRLIENPELRRAMGARGRAIAVEEFSLERVVSETLALYREMLER